MNREYINKRFQCPTCYNYEEIYLDMNELKRDERAKSGIVRKVIYHSNHGLILDIDLNGAVRTITPIKKNLDMKGNAEKLVISDSFLDKLLDKDVTMVFYSTDEMLFQLLQFQIQKMVKENHEFSVQIRKDCKILSLGNSNFWWISSSNAKSLPTSIDYLILDLEDTIKSTEEVMMFHDIPVNNLIVLQREDDNIDIDGVLSTFKVSQANIHLLKTDYMTKLNSLNNIIQLK